MAVSDETGDMSADDENGNGDVGKVNVEAIGVGIDADLAADIDTLGTRLSAALTTGSETYTAIMNSVVDTAKSASTTLADVVQLALAFGAAADVDADDDDAATTSTFLQPLCRLAIAVGAGDST